MKQMFKGLLAATMLLSTGAVLADCCTNNNNGCSTNCSGSTSCSDSCTTGCASSAFPLILPRSVSENAAAEMVGWETLINKFEMCKLYGAFYLMPEYKQSFKPCRMAQSLFGEALVNGQLTISGSQVADRGEFDLLADNFGLSTDFKSIVTFKPKIQNFVLDMGLYLGLDELYEGGFFRIHAPINWTKWSLNACEGADNLTAGVNDYAMGYMSSTTVLNSALKHSWIDAMSEEYVWGDMQESLKYGKISKCGRSKTRLADIQVALGWNFLQDEDYHFGLMIRGAFPTGNRPTSEYLFEPISGNGRHWELGGGLTSHAVLWRSECDEDTIFSVYVDANLTHLFKDKQTRSFDFKDKPLSRYMLIESMGLPVANLLAGALYTTPPTAPSAQYQEELFHAINKTTACTDVSIDFQGDLAIKFAYITGNWDFDLGYNLWGRTGEKFGGACCDDSFVPAKTYALKGDAFIYGFGASDATVAANRSLAVPLSATESKADIYSGTNTPQGTAYAATQLRNPSIDNATFAFLNPSAAAADALQLFSGAVNPRQAANDQRTSLQPVFVDELATCKGPSALSNKVFANIGYVWKDKDECEWIPFIGIGGEAEFGAKTSGNYSAISQWGVWVKGGLAFN